MSSNESLQHGFVEENIEKESLKGSKGSLQHGSAEEDIEKESLKSSNESLQHGSVEENIEKESLKSSNGSLQHGSVEKNIEKESLKGSKSSLQHGSVEEDIERESLKGSNESLQHGSVEENIEKESLKSSNESLQHGSVEENIEKESLKGSNGSLQHGSVEENTAKAKKISDFPECFPKAVKRHESSNDRQCQVREDSLAQDLNHSKLSDSLHSVSEVMVNLDSLGNIVNIETHFRNDSPVGELHSPQVSEELPLEAFMEAKMVIDEMKDCCFEKAKESDLTFSSHNSFENSPKSPKSNQTTPNRNSGTRSKGSKTPSMRSASTSSISSECKAINEFSIEAVSKILHSSKTRKWSGHSTPTSVRSQSSLGISDRESYFSSRGNYSTGELDFEKAYNQNICEDCRADHQGCVFK